MILDNLKMTETQTCPASSYLWANNINIWIMNQNSWTILFAEQTKLSTFPKIDTIYIYIIWAYTVWLPRASYVEDLIVSVLLICAL